MAKRAKLVLLVFAISASLAIAIGATLLRRTSVRPLDKISLYYPFSFRENLNPLNVFSVGDQVLSEHLFGFHARTSIKSGFESLLSDVTIESTAGILTVKPKYQINSADGSLLSFESICNSIKTSMAGTRHAPYGSILNNVVCDKEKPEIKISFKKIPVNLRFLLTLPDFCLVDPEFVPMTKESALKASTGPYYLKSIADGMANLSINLHYPSDLRANSIPDLELINYKAGNSLAFIESMSPKVQHGAYFFGFSINQFAIENLKSKGYTVELFPTEWFVYLVAREGLSSEVRSNLLKILENFKQSKSMQESLGSPAHSIAPSDRQFSLKKDNDVATQSGQISISKYPIKITTLKSWIDNPFFKVTIEEIKKYFPNLEIELLDPSDSKRLFSYDTMLTLAPLGISPTDPLTHFSFLESALSGFDKIISKDEIARASIIDDESEFNKTIQNLERKVVQSKLLMPIAHFPGVIAYRKDFKIDQNIAFGWGLQAWAFQVD